MVILQYFNGHIARFGCSEPILDFFLPIFDGLPSGNLT